jgi:hypothetical protein
LSTLLVPRLAFRDYAESRARTFTDIGTFFEHVRHDPDFLAIKSRGDIESYCQRKDLRFGERAFLLQIWRYYEQALRRAERGR